MTAKVELASNAEATSWEDITDEMYLQGARWAGTASRGEIDAGSGFNWRDDAGTRVIPWRRRMRVTETATTPDTVIWQGRTYGADVRRGPILVEPAKMFDVNLVDVNADFGGFPFAGTQRPEEDDVDRIDYLLTNFLQGQHRDSTVIGDTYFNRSIPYILAAHLYEGVQLIDWFTHMTDTTGRDFFFTKDYDLWHDIPASTSYASGLSITDDGPNYTTSFPPINPEATEDATEMWTGVRVRYSNGRVINVSRPAVEAANDQWRTSIVDESIGSAATATTRANRFLDEFDHSRTSFRCSILIPATLVDQISWGMTISFRSAACGILSPTTYRITRLSWGLAGEGLWQADLELNYASKFRRASVGGGSGNPGTTPVIAPVPFVPGSANVGDAELAVGSAAFGYPSPPDGETDWATEEGGSLVALENGAQYRLVFDQTTTFFAGGGFGYNFMSSASLTIGIGAEGVTANPAADWVDPDTMLADGIYPWPVSAPYTPGTHIETPWRIWDGTNGAMADIAVAGVVLSGYYGYEWGGTLRLEKRGGTGGGTEDDPVGVPSQGQSVSDTVGGDGTIDPGSPTTYPYAPRSLVIFVNGVNMASELTELDPSQGTYELANPVPEGAEVVRYYLGTGGII